MRFQVTKQEIWTQRVLVEAEDEQQARLKAEEGQYEIHDDPQYLNDHLEVLWKVEKVD
jgi:hypothetical protein